LSGEAQPSPIGISNSSYAGTPQRFGSKRAAHSRLFAMANLRAHSTLLATQLAATLTRLLDTHNPSAPVAELPAQVVECKLLRYKPLLYRPLL
jgi:hypothetical protein